MSNQYPVTEITLHHANDGAQITISVPQIFYRRFSLAQKCMIIVSIGGAFVPVRETEEQILNLLHGGQSTEMAQAGPSGSSN